MDPLAEVRGVERRVSGEDFVESVELAAVDNVAVEADELMDRHDVVRTERRCHWANLRPGHGEWSAYAIAPPPNGPDKSRNSSTL